MLPETSAYLPEDVQEARSMLACPYYRDPDNGTCNQGCCQEPACQVNEPTEGWDHIAAQ